jgi:hypothetical protein
MRLSDPIRSDLSRVTTCSAIRNFASEEMRPCLVPNVRGPLCLWVPRLWSLTGGPYVLESSAPLLYKVGTSPSTRVTH